MTKQEIVTQLNDSLHFPYQNIKVVKIMSEVIWIELSKQQKNEWAYGYLENSDYVKFIIHENDKNLFDYDESRIRSVKKPITGEKLVAKLIKELNKWKES